MPYLESVARCLLSWLARIARIRVGSRLSLCNRDIALKRILGFLLTNRPSHNASSSEFSGAIDSSALLKEIRWQCLRADIV